MTKIEELKNCPFCNQKPLGPEPADSSWWIECEHCEVIMDDNSKAELIKRWNNRPSNTQIHVDTKPCRFEHFHTRYYEIGWSCCPYCRLALS